MAASSQVYQSKRGRDEFWHGGISLPDAKRTNSRTLAHDTALMSLLEKIDNMDNNGSNPDETDVGINGIINSLQDGIQLKAQRDYNIDSTDDKSSSDQMGSIQKGQLTARGSTETIWVAPDFTYYNDVGTEPGFFADLITPHELGIMINDFCGDSMPHIMYSDPVYGYAETTEVFYGSLWDDDIWHLNELPVIQNDFSSPEQEQFEFHDVVSDGKPIRRVSDNEQ